MKDETDIQAMRDKAADMANQGSKYRGMTYEEGIRDALEWVLNEDYDISDEELLE